MVWVWLDLGKSNDDKVVWANVKELVHPRGIRVGLSRPLPPPPPPSPTLCPAQPMREVTIHDYGDVYFCVKMSWQCCLRLDTGVCSHCPHAFCLSCIMPCFDGVYIYKSSYMRLCVGVECWWGGSGGGVVNTDKSFKKKKSKKKRKKSEFLCLQSQWIFILF